MSKTDPHSSAEREDPFQRSHHALEDGWHQIESFIDQLQEAAHSPIDARGFYRDLLDGCVTLLAAHGGTVWAPDTRGQWRALHQIGHQADSDATPHLAALCNIAQSDGVTFIQPRSNSDVAHNDTDSVLAYTRIADRSDADQQPVTHSILELQLPAGSSPAVQQSWRELLEMIASVAGDFHVRDQLRKLRDERGLYDQSLELMQRFQKAQNLREAAYEIANEGRRFVGADRLSVVVRRAADWHVIAASGVERVEARADVTKRLQQLASATSNWGEPIEYSDVEAEHLPELAPELVALVQQHVDESQARRMVAVPVRHHNATHDSIESTPPKTIAVLVAEEFSSQQQPLSQQRTLELAGLCQTPLVQALQLERFPVRASLRWADRWEAICNKLGLTKLVATVAFVGLMLTVLSIVQVDYEVEAPATIRPRVERDVFASTDGKIREIKVAHGDEVVAGQVLAVLHDPKLLLESQRVEGEIATTRKRLEAIAVARTDRQVREESNPDQLPLSAEAEQLEKRLASLQLQQKILASRQEALSLRSPIDGRVLTLDVQNLLQTRPVQRGQVLFTVADTKGGWRLMVDLPQDRIGEVLAAQQADSGQLPVRFRVAGETGQTYSGEIASISTTAVLDTDALDQESPTFEVLVDVHDDQQVLARPGMTAEARILCGQRSLGYLWLHDIWDTVYSWLVF